MPVKSYVEFLSPGTVMANASSREVTSRDPLAVDLPRGAYAFRFYDIVEGEIDGTPVRSERVDRSKTYYPGGEIRSLEECRARSRASSILVMNMESNRWSHVIFGAGDMWAQPYDPEKDEVIPRKEQGQ
jgi:hypothetical protein